tara:strand:+ start:31 stop:459 length:429 start_codon:yes stop_codon:yes gene_type:complete
MAGYAPSLPLQGSAENDTYQYISDMKQLVKQNVRTLLFTAPGERIWDPQFGVGLRNYLFEFPTIDLKTEVGGKIKKQFEKYMPFLELRAVFEEQDPKNPAVLKINIKYFIKPLSVFEVLALNVNILEKSIVYTSAAGSPSKS